MKLLKLLFAALLLNLCIVSRAQAQIDSVFWFAAPWVTPSHAGNTPLVLRISTFNKPTTVRVYQPAGTYDSTFLVPPNSLNSHFLSSIVNTLESKPADNVLNYGLKIEADTLVTVVYEVVSSGNNPETYSLKGQNGLGTEFVCPFQTTWANGNYAPIQPKSMICIVATENNTTVWITPKANVVGHAANVTYSIVLQRGQTYTVENVSQATNTAGNNLAGTIVVADKKIAVTVSDDSVTNSGGGCRDLLGDQIVPTDIVGTEYIVNRGNMFSNSQEGVFIVATENFTTVNVTTGLGVTTQLLNKGDTYKYVLTATELQAYISADQNVYVFQTSGFGCELGAALLPPINCAGSNQVSFTRTNSQTFILNLLCPTSATGNFILNGSTTLVPASAFSVIPGTAGAWSGAQITFSTTDIPAGSSNFLTNSSDYFGMGVINGGSSTGCLYHYMSAFDQKVFVTAGNDTILCNGDPAVLLSGNVKGGSTTGEWTVVNGAGTFANAAQLSTSYTPSNSDYAQGSLTFVLSSTGTCDPVRDTLVVTFIQSPTVHAGLDATYCKNNVGTVPLNGSFSFAVAGVWSGGNGGVFANSGSAVTQYTVSPADLAEDSIALVFTSTGSFFSCPEKHDTVIIRFTAAPVVDAGSDQLVCSNTAAVILTGTVSGATTTGEWTSGSTGGFSPSQTDLNSGYILSVDDTGGTTVRIYLTSTNNGNCLAVRDSMDIQIIDFPVVSINTADSVCAGDSLLTLSGTVSPGFSVLWNTSGFGTIANPTGINTTYTITPVDLTNGFIDLHVQTTDICPSTEDSIRVTFVTPPVADAGPSQAYCENTLIQYNGVITGLNNQSIWSTTGTGQFLNDPANLQGTYQPGAADIAFGGVDLVLTALNGFGCPSESDTLHVVFNEIPTADFTFTNMCTGANMPFADASVMNNGTIVLWQWDFGDGDTTLAQSPLHNYSANGNMPVQLIVTSDNGCSDTIVKQITIYPEPLAAFSAGTACINTPTLFTDNSLIASGNITSYFYNFNGIGTSSSPDTEFQFPAEGIFNVEFTVVSDMGCSNTIVQQVTVHPAPDASFTVNPTPALAKQQVTFTDNTQGNIVNWQWNFGDGQGDNQEITQHAYVPGGSSDKLVTLIVTDNFGCMDTATRLISVTLPPVLPTGFSPNGDNENDVFIIRGGPFLHVEFKIYNNWGQLIFETTDPEKGWDGTYKGEPAPLGVYTWTFSVDMGAGYIVKESGDVTLIR